MANPTNVLGSVKLNGLVDINVTCICNCEIRHHVQLKRRFQSFEFQDYFLNLTAIGIHDHFKELSFVNCGNYLNFKIVEQILQPQFS